MRKWAVVCFMITVLGAIPNINAEDNQQVIVSETTANWISLVNTAPDNSNPASSAESGILNSFKRIGPAQPRNLGLSWPCGLSMDSQKRIYIVDFGHDRMLRVDDLAGNGLITLGEYGDGNIPLRFHMPYGIAIDSKDRIYVSDCYNARIVRFDDMTGVNWVQIGDRHAWSNERNYFYWPLGLAIDEQDRLYIADSGNNRIVRIDDIDGKGWTVCDGGISNDQKFNHPTGVSVGTDGAIYVADFGNNRIVRISDMSSSGWQAIESLDQPISVAVGPDGQLYAGMARNPGLHVFRSIKGDGVRILRTKSGPRGIIMP